ncbi:MAG TPA: YdcF family protein [Silvibacterium sp.]|nr:YdcF family protein [Silvibacterium sp.]
MTARLIIAAAAISLAVFAILHAGDFLVVNHPERSDVIVVLGGDHNDRRYWRGVELLRDGYGRHMLLDAMADQSYGQSFAERAANFVAESAGEQKSQIVVCTVTNDSTVQESSDVRRCLAQMQPAPQSALLVTNDFHTRRALSIFRSRLPQYRWSAAAVNDTAIFGELWWRDREWAKTCFVEWEKLLWWKLFESWPS